MTPIGTGRFTVDGDRERLQQTFTNVLRNAIKFTPEGGRVSVRAHAEGEAWVRIEVEDSGKGIREEHLGRIFEPFFTTKPVGQGTGLGLSLSYGIVNKHGGRFEVRSEVGTGTVFKIVLPRKAVFDTEAAPG